MRRMITGRRLYGVLIILFLVGAINLFLLLQWSGGSGSLLSSTPLSTYAEAEKNYARGHNAYYVHDHMLWMADIWPALVEASEKISANHIQQAQWGWPQASIHEDRDGSSPKLPTSLPYPSVVDDSLLFRDYWEACWRDRDHNDAKHSPHVSFFRLAADPICSFLWMVRLRQEPMQAIESVLAVVTREDEKSMGREDKPQQNGGMRAHLITSHFAAYWKPCTHASGNGESYLREIVAYHIDRILQFNRAPAVVPRFISAQDFRLLGEQAEDDDAPRKVETMLSKCGLQDGRGAEGSFVGWSPFAVELLPHRLWKSETPRLSELSVSEVNALAEGRMNISRHSPPEQIEWALELVTGHLYGILIGTLTRFRHNQHFFLYPDTGRRGPMIYIDNDRAQWDSLARDIRKPNPLQRFCVFPKGLSERIMMLASTHHTLGDILLRISDFYQPTMMEGPLFTAPMKLQLQRNIRWITQAIQMCIEKHGEEAVLIPEHWDSSSYDSFHFPSHGGLYQFFKSIPSQ